MNNSTSRTLSPPDKEYFEWIKGPYFSAVHALLHSNRAYLNQGITWSIGILTAVLIFGFTYIAPLQEVKDAGGNVTERSLSGILSNITEGDILLLTAVVSLAFAFVANFMSRSMKGFLNLVRYVSLYSRCVRVASGSVPLTADAVEELRSHITQYDDDFCPPLGFGVVLQKMATELGYGLFLAILVAIEGAALWAWLQTSDSPCNPLFWIILAFGPVWLVTELILLRNSSYFRFGGYPAQSWDEAFRRK